MLLTELGGIRVSSTTVWTPAGTFPLRGTRWAVTDRWHRREIRPTWAVVAAILGVFVTFALSLYLLRLRRTVIEGHVEISVNNGPWHHLTRVPVRDPDAAARLHHQVAYLRALSAI